MRIAVTALSVFLMIVSVMPGQIGAQALDPQSLIGEWTGKWVRQSAGSAQTRRIATSGAYRLVINKVEGRIVSADVYAEGAEGVIERGGRGTLEGNTLTFGPVKFTVTGNDMRGTRTSPVLSEINLTKMK